MSRGTSTWDDEDIDAMTTDPSCPWCLSTVATRTPSSPDSAQLLIGTIEVCVEASRVGVGRVIFVVPVDSAASFHQKFGFIPTTGPSRRLVMKMSTAAAALQAT